MSCFLRRVFCGVLLGWVGAYVGWFWVRRTVVLGPRGERGVRPLQQAGRLVHACVASKGRVVALCQAALAQALDGGQ